MIKRERAVLCDNKMALIAKHIDVDGTTAVASDDDTMTDVSISQFPNFGKPIGE